MTDFFSAMKQHFLDLMDFVVWFWELLEYLFTHFGIGAVVQIAFGMVSIACDLAGIVLSAVGATGVGDGLQDAASIMTSQNVVHLFAIAGWFADFFCPIEFLDPVIGIFILLFVLGFIVEHLLWVFHQFWGSS